MKTPPLMIRLPYATLHREWYYRDRHMYVCYAINSRGLVMRARKSGMLVPADNGDFTNSFFRCILKLEPRSKK